MQKIVYCIFLTAFAICLMPNPSISAEKQHDNNGALTLKEVLKSPDKYDGRKIIIDCFYYEATEKVVLASEVIEHEGGWRHVQDGVVWVTWHITPPKKLYSMLKKLPGRGRADYYGRVKVEGIFRKTEKGGHLGEYRFIFDIYKVSSYDERTRNFILIP